MWKKKAGGKGEGKGRGKIGKWGEMEMATLYFSFPTPIIKKTCGNYEEQMDLISRPVLDSLCSLSFSSDLSQPV